MNKRWKGPRRRNVAIGATAALAGLALAMPLNSGCNCSNRLPPNPVPEEAKNPPLPPWYPETPWSAEDGDSRVYIEGKIVYDTDSARIRSGESEVVLGKLLRFLQERPDVTLLRVEGHTDWVASDEYNQDLSARRSLSVCDWLVDRGIDHTRLLAVGFGESRPIAPNETSVGRQENRRTEFHVAEIQGAPFLGQDPSNGGLALTVLSKEERDKLAKGQPVQPPPPAPPPFQATKDEFKEVKVQLPDQIEEE